MLQFRNVCLVRARLLNNTFIPVNQDARFFVWYIRQFKRVRKVLLWFLMKCIRLWTMVAGDGCPPSFRRLSRNPTCCCSWFCRLGRNSWKSMFLSFAKVALPWCVLLFRGSSPHTIPQCCFFVSRVRELIFVNCVIYWPAVCSRMQINAVAFFREAISQFKARDLWRKTWAPAQSCRSSSWLFGSTQPTQPASCPRLPIPLSKPSIAAQTRELNRCTADVESDQLPPGGCQPALCAVVQFTRAPRRVFGGFNCFCLFWRCFSKIAYVFRGSMRECCRIVKLVFLGRVRVSWCQKFRVMRELSNQRYCAFFPRGFRIENVLQKKEKKLTQYEKPIERKKLCRVDRRYLRNTWPAAKRMNCNLLPLDFVSAANRCCVRCRLFYCTTADSRDARREGNETTSAIHSFRKTPQSQGAKVVNITICSPDHFRKYIGRP